MDSIVVTGAGRGVGRAIAETLALSPTTATVIALDTDRHALKWTDKFPNILPLTGDACDEETAARAAGAAGELTGWVNNAAVFRDASVHSTSPATLLELIDLNLRPAITGCAIAVRTFLNAHRPGAIVNISSHQARQAVPGCLPNCGVPSRLDRHDSTVTTRPTASCRRSATVSVGASPSMTTNVPASATVR